MRFCSFQCPHLITTGTTILNNNAPDSPDKLVGQRHSHFCPHRNCIAPPHMLESIYLRGNEEQRSMAEELLALSDEVREARAGISSPGTPGTPGVALASAARAAAVNREVYDGNFTASLPGTLARDESTTPPPADEQVNEAFDGAGIVHDLYLNAFGRDSLDNASMILVSTVHHRRNYNNAFWDGRQMAYGDGDGVIFTPLTGSLSVIGHELSHGVVQFSGGLIYRDQSGALNESFSDVFGALTVQYSNRETVSDANWLIGDGILGPTISGEALRSMKAPGLAYDDPLLGKDPQPYHMDYFVNTSADYGGVHINSGIPNHAFYLYAQYIGNYAWETPGQVWYNALQNLSNPNATFQDWAEQTVTEAIALFGNRTRQVLLLRRAWKLVGISV